MIKIINSIKQKNGEETREIVFFEMRSDAVRIICSNLGCHILSIFTKDCEGKEGDILLDFYDFVADYKGAGVFGSVVGRFANRIAKGRFELNGKEYKLAVNNGPNHLHGGIEGFHCKVFDYQVLEDEIVFSVLSPDGEEGYPGNLSLNVHYKLESNVFAITYDVTSDADTIINLTNHCYFNLAGHPERIDEHLLQIKAEKYGPVDGDGLVTGELVDVEGTPFDFRQMTRIGDQLHREHDQLTKGNGFDHPFALEKMEDQIILLEPKSGRRMSVTTDLPFSHIYTANYLCDVPLGKGGYKYEDQQAICFETEYMPDEINQTADASCILKEGERRQLHTRFVFEA